MSNEMVLLLTPLKSEEDCGFKAPTKAGTWEPLSGTLGELGQALDVDPNAAVDVVRSTPDPWAQARSFAEAVLNPGSRRPEIIDQWRGLIALFALADEYQNSYRIELTEVPLANSGTRFAKVMRHLLPRTTLPPTDNRPAPGWDTPVIVTLAIGDGPGINVGLLNPASLVAAGRDVELLRLSAVPWMRTGLTDPSKLSGADELTKSELRIIARYLDRVHRQLNAGCAGKGTPHQIETLRQLSDRLRAYRDDCLKRFGGIDPDDKFVTRDGAPPSANLSNLYLLCTVPIQADRSKDSDCVIRLRDDLGEPPFKGLVLLDRALESTTRPATDISFWGHTTLEQALKASSEQIDAWRRDIAASGYLLVTPDDLFTTVLVRMDERSDPASIAAHPPKLQNCLLPLSPLALLLHKPELLKSKVTMGGDGSVSLELMVGPQIHTMKRRYVKKPTQPNERLLLDEADWVFGDFAIWPDFASNAWKHYCARIDYATDSFKSVRGRFAMSGALMAQLLCDTTAAERRAEEAGQWGNSAPLGSTGEGRLDRVAAYADRKYTRNGLARLRASLSDGGVASEIQLSSTPFEAACFTVDLGSNEVVSAGLALLTVDKLDSARNQGGIATVDFGTTNTVACLNGFEPLKLPARIIHPIEREESGRRDEISGAMQRKFQTFMPIDDHILPTPTVIIDRKLDNLARDLVWNGSSDFSRAAFVKQMMYFQPEFSNDGTIASITQGEWSELLRNLTYNLKWSTEVKEATHIYIQQLVLMIACECARTGYDPDRLVWHFSRPRDMGGDDTFLRMLKTIVKTVLPRSSDDAVKDLHYESDAAATYILKEDTAKSGTKGAVNVILDIGGGTTDISIWSGKATPSKILSASVRIAGGDFFTGHIIENPEFLNDIKLNEWSSIISAIREEGGVLDKHARARNVGELLFSGKTLDQAITREWTYASDKPAVKGLKETAFVFLAGIAWLVGRHLRDLIREEKLAEADLDDISVALCGRGSGLFARLHGTDAYAETEISNLLMLIPVAAGQYSARRPQVKVSPSPKIEVAAGMMIEADRQRQRGASDAEKQSGGDQRKDFGSKRRASSGATGEGVFSTMIPDIGMDDLDEFLEIIEEAVGLSISLDREQRSKIVHGVAEIDQADVREKRPPQSEFVSVLKMLVKLLRLRPTEQARPKTSW